MLLFQLIPYFLAVQINNNNVDNWKYGPEYKFSGHLKMITSLDSDKGTFYGTIVDLTLKCRPREPDTLRCQLDDSKIIRLKPQNFDIYQDELDKNDNYRDINLIKEPFEINFNKNGINSYTLENNNSHPIAMWTVNMARLIANQLNFGGDLSDEMKMKFHGWENFTVGECEVDFIVKRKPIMDDETLVKKKREFLLTSLEGLGQYRNEIITISKKRNLNNCLRHAEPFFGTRYTLGLILRDVSTDLKASKSMITASKHEFSSETTNESDVYGENPGENKKLLGKVIDHMKLNLVSVEPAKEKIDNFRQPIKFGVLSEKLEHGQSQY